MNVFINNKLITQGHHQSVSFKHRGFVVSIAQGGSMREFGIHGTEIIIFPEDKREIIDPDFKILALHDNHASVAHAIRAIDMLADALALGLIELRDDE